MTHPRIRLLGAIAVLVPLLAACAPGTGDGGTLEGTRWVVDSVADETGVLAIAPEAVFADAEFAEHRISGFGGCNEFRGLYRAGGRTLRVSDATTTLMACDSQAIVFEQAYLSLLDRSRFYSVRRDTLTVFDSERNAILRFDAAPRNPLLGPWVVDSIGDGAGTVTAPIEGSAPEVVFRIGTVGGFVGCNAFSGVYGTNGSAVWVSSLAVTRTACGDELIAQDAAITDALEGAALIEDRGSQVNLTDRQGRLRLALVDPRSVEPTASPAEPPAASEGPTTEPTEEPSATPSPTPSPTPEPTTAPTQPPTEAPTAAPTAPASGSPPPSPLPPTATCDLVEAEGMTVATIVYPGSWSTPMEPPGAACRYFDPEPITLPDDGSAPDVAARADALTAPYLDAVASATDTAGWDVATETKVEVGGVPVTCILATATDEGVAGVPVGTVRYQCLADVGSAGTVAIRAETPAAEPPSAGFKVQMAVVSLMTSASTFIPPA